ncbi:hypothetical protein SAMN02799631_06344 [Methylobacterium sp. 174MFSha1.1]|uniref:hypothetical protein n=1 Tax=Methylobacterium sp. 174MFSha1.1 TaxID=1502749 RepID=UPI0008E3DC1D|nr:hypothetical protein [Methylobacterium sp. 174MFSha1.1]SFV16244.1 hypothetical protein SAMN02799631_06344 [Methylobacterium sp. 174MFSha1.1]
MTYAKIKEAIAWAHPRACADLRAQLYALHAQGLLTDDDAAELDVAIEAQRKGLASATPAPAGLSLAAAIAPTAAQITKFALRRQRSPDRARSRERRRGLGGSSPLPEPLARRYTEGQRAVLFIVGEEIAVRGVCGLSVAEIAARAGVCHRHAQMTLRLAEGDGLLSITERPRKGQTHQTNLVRVLSREWAAWLQRRRPTGCKPIPSTGIQGFSSSLKLRTAARGSGGRGFRREDSGSGPAGRPAASSRF